MIVNSQTKENEKIEEWIFPKEDNFKRFKMKTFDKNGKAEIDEPSLQTSFYNISENQVGTIDEFFSSRNEEVIEQDFKLYEITIGEIKLLKSKTRSSGYESNEHNFYENNVYWKLPPKNYVIKWNYTSDVETFVKCKSYWKLGKENEEFLVVEREFFEGKDVELSREKSIEFYGKNRGLFREEYYLSGSKKISMLSTPIKSVINPNIKNADFPLGKKQDSPVQPPLKTDSISVVKKLEFPDGSIPKEYIIQILADRGFPYLVKDTITIKNSRGEVNIPPPKFIKSEKSIYYNGKEVAIGDYIEGAKIIGITYFRSPFSTKQEVYYSDGEGNFKIVKNSGLYLEEDNTINTNISTSGWIMKEIKKDSEIFLELSKDSKLKKQGIYIIRDRISEENVKLRQVLQVKYTDQE